MNRIPRFGRTWIPAIAGMLGVSSILAPTALRAFQLSGESQLASTLVMGDKAVNMLPPRSISDWVNHAQWSPTGKYVLYTQSARYTPAEVVSAVMGVPVANPERFKRSQLMAWNRANGRSTRIDQIQIGYFEGGWFASDDVYVHSDPVESGDGSFPESWRLLFHSLRTGTTRAAMFEGIGQLTSFASNQASPLMALMARKDDQPTTIFVFGPTGEIKMRTLIPSHIRASYLRWLKDGTTLFANATDQINPKARKSLFLDTKTGEYRLVDTPRDVEFQPKPEPKQMLEASIQTQEAFFGSPKKIRVAVLGIAERFLEPAPLSIPENPRPQPKPKADDPTTAFIAADVQSARVAPSQDAVLYVQNGVALVREFALLPLDAYKQMRETAQREEIMSRAKQMGTAMQIYAMDSDETFPSVFDPDAIYPYVRSRDMMDGFVYTFTGGDMRKIGNLSKVEMGYILGPGGRAVVYLDTHVKWIKDPPPVTLFARQANLL